MSERRWDASIERVWNPVERQISLGAHVVFERGWYEHHAIYVGDGSIVEYHESGVRAVTLAEVTRGSGYWLLSDDDRCYPALFSGTEVADRAVLRLHEAQYDGLENNCEHFANWALNGFHHCEQTDFGVGLIVGALSWCLSTRDESWHRARLAREFPQAHEAAAQRQRAWAILVSQGVPTQKAAKLTRARFSTAVRPDLTLCGPAKDTHVVSHRS